MASDTGVLESLEPDPDVEPSSSIGKCPGLHLETSPRPQLSKGKAPIVEISAAFELHCDEEDDDGCSGPQQCGICLSEEGQAVRGRIDSCDHYFCFRCIIEWSKIESRCPLCKRRFSGIRRVRKDGSLIGDRAVVVPVRDQVYDPNGNTTSGPLDLYANIKCNICANSTDENLLLLCDLCDSAVHTYCAGLGATVPEGDWFCQECALMKAEELNTEPKAELGASHTSDQCNTGVSSIEAPISVYDIVREPKDADPEVNRLFDLFSPHQNGFLSSRNALPRPSQQNAEGACGGSGLSKRSEVEVRECSTRTLPRCRDVQKHITALRENWNALRSGSLCFPSGRFDSEARNSPRANDSACGYISNGSQPESSENSAVRPNVTLGGDVTNKYDVDRAWKMFDVAKSVAAQKLSGSSSSSSKNLSLQTSASKSSKSLLSSSSSKNMSSSTKREILTGSEVHCSFSKSNGCVSKRSEQYKKDIRLERGKSSVNHAGLEVVSCVTSIVSSSHNTQKLTQTDLFCRQGLILPQKKPGRELPYLFHQKDISTCKTPLAESLAGPSRVPCNKLQIKPVNLSREVFSGCNIDAKNPCESEDNGHSLKSAGKRISTEEFSSGSKRLKFDDAKSEVQALVKLSLKLLTGKQKLEVDKFKDIARCSTHEILAACGLEPHRRNKLPIPKSICSHSNELQDRHKSLMPGSCSECFYVFVKDVVSSIMSQKMTC